jgi:response regulator NasT
MNSRLTIGVAEDEADMQEFYKFVVPELGYNLLWVVRDGVDMVKQCEQSRPDLLIADVKMPRLDGIDAVRSIASHNHLPVILVTGYYDEETVRRAEVAQVSNYLIKPIREADLNAAIRFTVQQFENLESLRDDQQHETITRAAHALANGSGMSNEQAYYRLEQIAVQENRQLVEVAETILAAAELWETDSTD